MTKRKSELEHLEIDGKIYVISEIEFDALPKMSPEQYSKIFDEARMEEFRIENN